MAQNRKKTRASFRKKAQILEAAEDLTPIFCLRRLKRIGACAKISVEKINAGGIL
jgi:hypothetical protein